MAKSTRARYTQEFKFEAVRLVKGGQGLAVTAKILGISDQTLHNGVNQCRILSTCQRPIFSTLSARGGRPLRCLNR